MAKSGEKWRKVAKSGEKLELVGKAGEKWRKLAKSGEKCGKVWKSVEKWLKWRKVTMSGESWGKVAKSWKSEFIFAKWPPAAILDVQKSLLITFLTISDQYATFFFFNFFLQNGRQRPDCFFVEHRFGGRPDIGGHFGMEGSGVGIELWSRNSHGGAIFGDWHDCPGVGNSARYEPTVPSFV